MSHWLFARWGQNIYFLKLFLVENWFKVLGFFSFVLRTRQSQLPSTARDYCLVTWLIQSHHQYKILTSKYFSDLVDKTEHKPEVMEKKHLDVFLGFIPSAHSFKLHALYFCFQGGQALTGWWFWGHKAGEKVDLWRVTLPRCGRCSVAVDKGCGRWVGGGWTRCAPPMGCSVASMLRSPLLLAHLPHKTAYLA